jgi:hypothetical protein
MPANTCQPGPADPFLYVNLDPLPMTQAQTLTYKDKMAIPEWLLDLMRMRLTGKTGKRLSIFATNRR